MFQDPAGRIAVTSSGDVIDMRTGQSLARIPAAARASTTVSYALDWPLLAVVVPHSLVVLDLRQHTTRTLRTDRVDCSDGIGNAVVSAHTQMVFIACDDTIEPIDISSWPWRPAKNPVPTGVGPNLPTSVGSNFLLSPDGQALAVLGDNGLELFAVNGARLRARGTYQTVGSAFAGFDGAIAFTSDTHTLVWARAGGLIDLIGVNQPTLQSTTLAQPDGQIPTSVAVSADGSLLAVKEDGVGIRMWDLAAKQLLGTIPDVPNAVSGIVWLTNQSVTVPVFGPSETSPSVADTSTSNSWSSFDLDPASWQRRACTIANRNLTQVEWAQYLPSIPYRKTCPDAP